MEKIGRYEIIKEIGKGGMGVVYKAFDPSFEQEVAIKTLSAGLCADSDFRSRFLREARSARKLRHNNIITVYDLGEDHGRPYLVMEFLEGRNLKAEISETRWMTLERKLEIMQEICQALAHAHDRNIIHRDIKPSNIFITSLGEVKLLDFGLARTVSADTQSNMLMGTANYMAPEQWEKKADHRSDIFAAGAVFYELLNSKKAFDGDDPHQVMYQIIYVDPEPVEKNNPAIPTELSAIIRKAIEKDQASRYQQMQEMVRDLHTFQVTLHERKDNLRNEAAEAVGKLNEFIKENQELLEHEAVESIRWIATSLQREPAQSEKAESDTVWYFPEDYVSLWQVTNRAKREYERLNALGQKRKELASLLSEALVLERKGAFDSALEILKRIVEADPDHAWAASAYRRLLTHVEERRLQEALQIPEAFRKAGSLSSRNALLPMATPPGDSVSGTTIKPSELAEVSEQRARIEPGFALTSFRVALLYKRSQRTDEQILKLLEEHLLADGHQVFIDRHLSIGVEWAKEIERQLRSADAVIVLLSAASVTSEMLAYEVQIAHEAAQQRQGKPRLLPVRVNYEGSMPDTLAGFLDPLQYAVWNGPQDNQRLVTELITSLHTPAASRPAARRQKLEPVGGAVPLDSEFYIVRPTDGEFRVAIARHDSIVLVKGARQMGKTSLLARGLQQAREAGAKVVLTDFQKLSPSHLESIETLLLTLSEMLADQLDLEVLPDRDWSPRRGASINFERYLHREVLGKIASQLVWGLDEVDRLFSCDYGSQIFGLFRSWHNARALDPTGPWRRLTLAIVYATEAHLFITDLNQSPFNVGTRLLLEDFSFEQVTELNRRYGSPLQGTSEIARYVRLVGGHPYLVRRGLNEMATHSISLAAFEDQADRDEGPFGDHLRRIVVLLAQDPVLCDAARAVLRGQHCPTSESFYRLRSGGVVSGNSARDPRPRCQLYATYLERHLL